MLSKIVSAKLKQGRRLVIPDLGMFVVREDGHVLFSELIRRDDGVFRGAVAAERGIGDSDAAHMVERFVSDIHHSLNHGMSYRLEGLGLLLRDDRGFVVFKPRNDEAVEPLLNEKSAGGSATVVKESEPAAADEVAAPTQPSPRPRPEQRPRPRPKRREGVDMFMIVAIVIAVVAIAAIAYGLWVSGQRNDTFGDAAMPGSEQAEAQAEADSGDLNVVDLSVPSGKR